jgi:glycosyltransferase involved in cell wall biosynthesis
LAISQTYPKRPGDSTAPFVAAIVENLAKRGHALDVVLPYHPEFAYPETERIRFFSYRYSPRRTFAPWGFGGSMNASSRLTPQAALVAPLVVASLGRRISQLLARSRYDIVHAHWLLPNALVAAGRARRRRVPLVVSVHGTDVGIGERKGMGGLAARALAGAGAVTAPSDDLRERVVALGARPESVATIPYGVDTDAFAPEGVQPMPRRELGANGDDLLVVAVGRLIEVKGFRYLLQAGARVDRVRLAIIGDGPLRRELESLARELRSPVTFAGNVDHADMPGVLAAADVVAVPSVTGPAGNTDGLPNTLLEALASGKPVVASALGGIPDVVTHRDNGLLTAEKDVDGIASALVELRDQPQLRVDLGAHARQRAVRELDWAAIAAAYEAAYLLAAPLEDRDAF